MPGTRKRKHTAVEDQQSSKQTKSTKIQKSIHAYGKLEKKHDVEADGKKRKASRQWGQQPTITQTATTKAECKRKREVLSDSEDEIVVAPRSSIALPKKPERKVLTPRNKRCKDMPPPTPIETPTRGTLALFDRLKIDGNSRAIPCALPKKQISYNTPPDTPANEESEIAFMLPDALEDLRDLHTSFLASLSLYYSHNGSTSPVNVTALLPMVTKHWKRRDVRLDDLQRLLAIGEVQSQEFNLQDHGRAGICINRIETNEHNVQRATSFIEEEKLHGRFEESLRRIWTSWQASTPKENRNATAFVDQLALVDITINGSVHKAAPLFARGQQRLAELKASKTAAKTSVQALSAQSSAQPLPQPTQSRGTALLDRILAKQSKASNLPAGPTKEQLERKSALHRIEDISRVLSLLAGTKERCSFSLQAIIQHLQQSLRNPISREEVERCLGLMSTEILPGFVKLVQSGQVQGVVVAKSANVGLTELRARVEQACT